MPRFEDIFEVICERNQSPFAVLSKYKDDPDVLVSFANILEPRVMKEPEPLPYGDKRKLNRKKSFDKKTKRLGINPHSSFSTPIGIYGFPLKVYWDNWLSVGKAHFAIERPIIWIYKPRNPERCARSSTYSEQDLERDFEKLREMFPEYKYDPEGILLDTPLSYQKTPFQKFWTVTRALAQSFNRTQVFPDDDGKLRETKTRPPIMWTRILMRFYDGMIDDLGESTIHENEPWQGVIWVNSLIVELDHVDRRKIEKSKRLSSYVDWGHEDSGDVVQKNATLRAYLLDRFQKGNEDKIKPNVREAIKDSKTFRLIMMAYEGNPDLMIELPRSGLGGGDIAKLIGIFLSKEPEIDDKFIGNDVFEFITNNYLGTHMDYVLDHTYISSLTDENLSTILQKLAYNISPSTLRHFEEILHVSSTRRNSPTNTMGVMSRVMKKLPDEYIKDKLHEFVVYLSLGIGTDNYIYEEDLIIEQLIRLLPMMKGRNEYVAAIMPIMWNSHIYRGSKEIFLDTLLSLYGENSDLASFIKESLIDNRKEIPISFQDKLDGIWFKYFGTTVYKDEYSQTDVMNKSKTLKTVFRGKPKFKVGASVKTQDGRVGSIRDVLRAKRTDPIYSVEWEDGDISPIRQSELKEDIKIVHKPFERYDKVEDPDGNVYEYYKDSSETPGHVTVYDSITGKYKSIDPNDLIKYDYNNPMKEIPFKVGDYVKIIKGSFKGKRGTLIAVNNFYKEVTIKMDQDQDQGGVTRYEDFNYVEKIEKDESVLGKEIPKPSDDTEWEPIEDIMNELNLTPLESTIDLSVGDTVICVDNEDYENLLSKGKSYIVQSTSNKYIRVISNTGNVGGFEFYRFAKKLESPTDTNDEGSHSEPLETDNEDHEADLEDLKAQLKQLTAGADIGSQKPLPTQPKPKPLQTTEGLSVGDKIKCLDNSGLMDLLTVGAVYTIRKILLLSDLVELQGDNGVTSMFKISRFAKVKVAAKKQAAYKPKYSIGDTFLTTSGDIKYVVLDVNSSNYKIQEYSKDTNGWQVYDEPYTDTIKGFDQWVADTAKAGTMFHDVKI
jgi:hypothetical protein